MIKFWSIGKCIISISQKGDLRRSVQKLAHLCSYWGTGPNLVMPYFLLAESKFSVAPDLNKLPLCAETCSVSVTCVLNKPASGQQVQKNRKLILSALTDYAKSWFQQKRRSHIQGTDLSPGSAPSYKFRHNWLRCLSQSWWNTLEGVETGVCALSVGSYFLLESLLYINC